MTEMTDLTAKLLIAMPGMDDSRFDKTVIFVCAHSDEGAMGLVVNQPADELEFVDLLEQLDLSPTPPERDIRIHVGGPVEHGRGFVLHSGDYVESESTMPVGEGYGMTATLDILEDIARGNGPGRALLALGYAGWGPGQLEHEIASNGWLTCDATPDLVFAEDSEAKWKMAVETMGVDPRMLSSMAGHA
ncbi:YqgE/AlgH family protein [Roseicyclus sp. F158]|uniref:UPF0301 protein RM543_01350 n=1 Tax=Tropicimonas omnivorans TaxID=3075590 RepID=A0ABU3DCM0_9RHOB|nr:YqgE/AlgH family protein [Roseicyclus sp. F158]MDT0681313.1 YqgE/AlgH family protein [Roseicyclus sp. F158]